MSRIFSRFGFQKAHAQACAAPNHLTGWTGYVTTTGGVTPDSVRVDVSLRPGYPTVFCGGLSSGTHYTDGAGYYNTGLNYSCFTSWQATFSKANCTSASRDLYQAVGDNGHMHSGDQNITLTCSLPPTYPYTIQGYRTYGSGSGTAFPSGTGTTTICGTGYTNNYFQVTGIPGDCYISSSSPIIHGGRTYDLIGNSMCYDTTSCHGGGPNNPAGYEFLRHVDLSGPTAGRYVDIYWHYRLRDAAPTLSITSSCATKRYTITASDADGSPVPVEYQIRTNGGSWSGWTSVSVSGSYNYDMSSRSQYDVYEMQVRTRGVVAAGNPTPAYTTAGPRVYGVSSTRACLDRGFSVDAIPRKPVLTPDPEDPSSATFGSSARSTITPTPAGNPTAVIGVSMDRDYFVRHVSGTVTSISPGPSSPDPRSVNVPRSSDLPDITDSRSLASLTLNSGDAICVRVTLSPASGTVDTAGNIITGSGSNTDESCEFVVSKPYFRVYNSDVSSGFVNCTGWSSGLTSGQILGWNHGNGAGSGTQLAAYAVGTINEFSTATGRTSTAPLPPKGLTFANNTGATYGAGFGSGFCAYDYFGNKSSSASVSTGNVTIPGRTLSPGQKIAVYVDGNAYITGNIQYPATWASISDIPSYVLIVRGNIYINPSVTRLDGLYVAQPNGASGGELLTCALGFSSPTVAQLATNCATSLTFNGSIVAKWPRLLRTNGSLRNSSNTEARSSATAAEKFIFGPESWLSNAVEYPDSPIEYDSATSSAPIL